MGLNDTNCKLLDCLNQLAYSIQQPAYASTQLSLRHCNAVSLCSASAASHIDTSVKCTRRPFDTVLTTPVYDHIDAFAGK